MAGASVALALASSAAVFAAPAPGQAFDFHLEAGPLDASLTAFSNTTGTELLYSSTTVRGRQAPRVAGHMPAEVALARLLKGSGIIITRPSARVIVLSAPAAAPSPAPALPGKPAPPTRKGRKSRPETPVAGEIQGIVVTGTHIRGQSVGPSPLTVLDGSALQHGGRATIADALSTLPQNFGGTATESTLAAGSDRQTSNDGAASSINLRGLGSNATLTLIDGRRVAGAGGDGDFTDLSSIPMVAVDRIEVLADGASALYGSDAVGGVVNIILRQRLDGAESQLRVGSVTSGGTRELDFGQLVGKTWSTGHALLAYEYYHRDALAASSRDFSRSDDLRPFGGQDYRGYYALPATVLVFDPVTNNLIPGYAVPGGQDGTALTPGSFTVGANLQNDNAETDLLPRQTRHSLYVTAEQKLSSALRFYGEGRFSHRRFDYRSQAATALFDISSANPWFVSPDGQTDDLIAYSFLRELGPAQNFGHVTDASGTVGARISPGGGWEIDSYVGHAEEWTGSHTTHLVNTARLDEALGNTPPDPASGFDPMIDGYFNPYGNGTSNSRAILDFIGTGTLASRIHSRMTTAESKADGPLFALPGGSMRLAVGGSWRHEALTSTGENFLTSDNPVPFSPIIGDRTVLAGYAELAVPLFGKGNQRPGLRRLDLSLAVRHEHHSDYGDTTNPKLGVVWEPVSGLMLRGSYGTSFRSPSLREINSPFHVTPTQLPNAAGGFTPVLFLTGGNAHLRAERAKSWSIGTVIAPAGWHGFHAEATIFQTRFRDRIGQPAFEDVLVALRDPSLAPFVTPVSPATSPADLARVEALINDPGSQVPPNLPASIFQAIVDGRFINTAQTVVRGLDASVTQGFALAGGRATASASLSWLIDYKEQRTPAGPLVERVDTVGFPARLRGQVSLDWTGRAWGGTFTLHHVSGYHDDLNVPERSVDSWSTLDLQLRYTPPHLTGLAHGITLALNVQNATDAGPPFINRSIPPGYDPANADPLGRFVSLQICKAW